VALVTLVIFAVVLRADVSNYYSSEMLRVPDEIPAGEKRGMFPSPR